MKKNGLVSCYRNICNKSVLLSVSMLIPNAINAVVDICKLRDYCLNPNHDIGKHKARLFSSTLGMTADDAEDLRQILLKVVITQEARLQRQDEFGQRYTLDFVIEWQNRSATLRSGWIIEQDSEIPKLTTCYPL
jgi:hypothetical protein